MRKLLSIFLMLCSVVFLQAQPSGSDDCSVDFSATVDNGAIFLSGSATLVDSTDFVSEWFWVLGQGFVLTGQDVVVETIFGAGVYSVCLTITTNEGCTATACQDVTVGDIDSSDCATIANGTSPYAADDSIFLEVIAQDPFCCTGTWDGVCQNLYDELVGGGTDSTGCYIWAGFFATTSGTTTSFTDFSNGGNTAGGIISWLWDFGDGNTSTEQNPTNEYAEEGVYTVCLTVTDAAACTDTNCQDVVVGDIASGDCLTIANGSSPYAADDSIFIEVIAQDPYCCNGTWDGICQGLYDEIAGGGGGGTDSLCTAYFYHTASDSLGNQNPIGGFGGLTVAFWDASQGAGSWEWNMGDGTMLTGPQITHTYAETGVYTICLTITNDTGCTATYCEDIYVSDAEFCYSEFYYFPSQDSSAFSFSFEDFSTTNATSWAWDFGDGNTSDEQHPEHTYADYGEYEVCLTITTDDDCSSTSCYPLIIWNPADCEAHFWHSALPGDSVILDTIVIIDPGFGGLTVTFFDCSLGSPDTWTWDFGDGTTGEGSQLIHTYAEAGTYTVCLTISNEAGCDDTVCQDILVQESPWDQCYAEFSFYSTDGTATTPGNTFQFEDWSSNDVVAWQWDFGDGTSSSEQNPIHTYEDGMYTACLTVVTADGCVSDMCASLIAGDGGWQPTGLSLCGSINVSNNFNAPTVYDATVYLIEYDVDNGTLTAVDSTIAIGFGWGQDDSSSFSFYCFDGLEEGSEYLVKAAMNPWSPLYNDYLPTYYESALSWMDATSVVVNDDVFGVDINMVAGENPGGPGFIGGNISDGAGKSLSEVGGIMVILIDSDGNPVGFTHTDEDGNYSFKDIAYGTYTVHIEILNIPSEPFSVTIHEDAPSFEDANFVRESGEVTADFSSSIDELILAGINNFNIAPNPVQNRAFVSFNAEKEMQAELQIFNLMGQRLEQKEVSIEVGANNIEVEMADFAEGMYLLQLSQNGQAIHQVKVMKQ